MAVANPREIPEYELNPLELQVRKADGIAKAWSYSPSISVICACNDNFFFVICQLLMMLEKKSCLAYSSLVGSWQMILWKSKLGKPTQSLIGRSSVP